MENDHRERFDYAETLYEPAIEDKKFFVEDVKPPVVTGHDQRYRQSTGGRSTPNHATAPDGVSGNWR